MILQDVLKENLDVVFCGTAVGTASALKQSYYAGPGNQFYSILAKTKLTPKRLMPENYRELLNYKIGLTDLVKGVSGNDNVLKTEHFDVQSFGEKIMKYQPKIVCFNGKAAAAALFNSRNTSAIDYGFLTQTIGKTRLFVAPSTSGSARGFWDEKYWYLLKKELENN